MSKKIQQKQHGAVLIIAIFVSSIALAVGLGVYNRTYKELLFASYWRQIQLAFSAADSGLECALYWDIHPGTVTPRQCFGVNIGWTAGAATGAAGIDMQIPGGGCVNIKITKPASPPSTYATLIEARGNNDACGSVSTRRVERGLNVSY